MYRCLASALRDLPSSLGGLVVAVGLAAACGDRAGTSVRHPQQSRLDRSIPVTQRVRLPSSPPLAGTDPLLMALAFRDTVPRFQLGRLEGDQHELFGKVAAVRVLGPDDLYVLDARYLELRVYDRAGTFKSVIGRAGTGPGEFRFPSAFASIHDRVLAITDGPWVHLFDRRGPNWDFRSRALTGFGMATDVCAIRDTLFVHGMAPVGRGKEVIHRFSIEGEAYGSFGRVYTSPNQVVLDRMSTGHLACSEEHGFVFHMPWYLPELRAYSSDGTLQWLTVFEPARLPLMEESWDGALSTSYPESGEFFQIVTLKYAPGRNPLLIVQFKRHTDKSDGVPEDDYGNPYTVLLDPSTGKESAILSSVPRIVEAGSGVLVTETNEPFPRLTMWFLRSGVASEGVRMESRTKAHSRGAASARSLVVAKQR